MLYLQIFILKNIQLLIKKQIIIDETYSIFANYERIARAYIDWLSKNTDFFKQLFGRSGGRVIKVEQIGQTWDGDLSMRIRVSMERGRPGLPHGVAETIIDAGLDSLEPIVQAIAGQFNPASIAGIPATILKGGFTAIMMHKTNKQIAQDPNRADFDFRGTYAILDLVMNFKLDRDQEDGDSMYGSPYVRVFPYCITTKVGEDLNTSHNVSGSSTQACVEVGTLAVEEGLQIDRYRAGAEAVVCWLP